MAENVEQGITSMMEEKRVFKPSKELSKQAYIKSMAEYKKIYQKSIDDPEAFWGEMALQLDWFKKWDKVLVQDFAEAKHQWFVGGKLNVSYNCIDRHLKTARKNKAAIIWEGDIGDYLFGLRQNWRGSCRCFRRVQRRCFEGQNCWQRIQFTGLQRWVLS
jgi:hypothetical protein